MAKGSMFWSRARGKVGDIVLSQVKGQTITRAYQPQVLNPKTNKQMAQRARFAANVEFYKIATKNFFRFAYEDKAQKESDYNAYMRHNVSAVMPIYMREQVKGTFPKIAKGLMLSVGSLAELQCHIADASLESGNSALVFDSIKSTKTDETWGDFSAKVIENGDYTNKDILTIVKISSTAQTIYSQPETKAKWEILQFVLDTTNTTPLATTPIKVSENNNYYVELSDFEAVAMAGAIVSHPTEGGLKVSTAELKINQVANLIWFSANENVWVKAALESWGANPEAILEGTNAVAPNDDALFISRNGLPKTLETGEITFTISGRNLGNLTTSMVEIEDYDGQILGNATSVTPSLDGTSASITANIESDNKVYIIENESSRVFVAENVDTNPHINTEGLPNIVEPSSAVELMLMGKNLNALQLNSFDVKNAEGQVQGHADDYDVNEEGTVATVTFAMSEGFNFYVNLGIGNSILIAKCPDNTPHFDSTTIGKTFSTGLQNMTVTGSNLDKAQASKFGKFSNTGQAQEMGSDFEYNANVDGTSATIKFRFTEGGQKIKYNNNIVIATCNGEDE